jgi:hypothetical protein
MVRSLAGALLCLAAALPAAALANAEIQSLRGDVRVGNTGQLMVAGRQGQRLASGTTVSTGADSQAVLKFDDGGQMVLGQNTEFRIVDSQYSASLPGADRGIFDLVRGALRVVSGAIGSRNRQAWALRAPQVTIGLRGTDFMVLATANQTFLQVTHGAIAVSNGYGTSVIGAGAAASVASSTSAVAMLQASQLPGAASSAFASMTGAPGVVAGGMGVGAGPAGGVASGGIGAGTMAIGIGAAAAALAAGGKSSSTATHH